MRDKTSILLRLIFYMGILAVPLEVLYLFFPIQIVEFIGISWGVLFVLSSVALAISLIKRPDKKCTNYSYSNGDINTNKPATQKAFFSSSFKEPASDIESPKKGKGNQNNSRPEASHNRKSNKARERASTRTE